MPPGPTDGPGGVTGAARTRDVGNTGPAVSQNAGAMPATGTSSSSLLRQGVKVDETGVPMYRSQGVMSDQPSYAGRRGASIIDEYGNRYHRAMRPRGTRRARQ